MLKSIVFYNWTHNGDIFASKEYVRELIELLDEIDFKYYHSNSKKLIQDLEIEILSYSNIELLFPKFDNRWGLDAGETLYINTWICSYASNTNWLNYYKKFKDEVYPNINRFLGTSLSVKDSVYSYIPEINYSAFNDTPFNYDLSDYEETMIFSNGSVLSGQSHITDLNPIIERLLEEFPQRTLILTEKTNIKSDKILYTDDLIDTTGGDLNEISYLADKCAKYIIGRDSGPFCYMNTKAILNNPNKKVVSLGVNSVQTFYYNMSLLSNPVYINETDLGFMDKLVEFWRD